MAPRDVSIVIPTWNGRHLLAEFLPSVTAAADTHRAATGSAVEIVVVDDGSTDDTARWLAEASAHAPVPLRVVTHEQNLGFGAACNRGVREARHPLILLLNNDVEILPGAIAPLVPHVDQPGSAFAVHCRAIDQTSGQDAGLGKLGGFARGFLRVHGSFAPGPGAQPPFPSMFAGGGAAMFDRARFLAIGGFDPVFAPYYYEDVELSYRAWKRGFEVRYEPASVVRHRFSSTIGALQRARVRRISHRNRLWFHWIHLQDRRWMAAHLLMLPWVTLAGALTLRWHVPLGLLDALRGLGRIGGRRRAERLASVRSDREVVRIFEELRERVGIVVRK